MYKYVYFVLAEELNHVKIGMTTDINQRLSSLNSGHSCELRLLYYFPCSKEKEIHKLFNHLRVKGEWFKYNEEIKAFINAVKIVKGNFIKDKGMNLCYLALEGLVETNNINCAFLFRYMLNSFLEGKKIDLGV
jgi:predicted GIY-YIG superfamily endonuclease